MAKNIKLRFAFSLLTKMIIPESIKRFSNYITNANIHQIIPLFFETSQDFGFDEYLRMILFDTENYEIQLILSVGDTFYRCHLNPELLNQFVQPPYPCFRIISQINSE